jgi:cytochrome c oxidase cbb3-type subunit III
MLYQKSLGLVLALGMITGGALAGQAPITPPAPVAPAENAAAPKGPPPKYDPASVERGQKIFASTCGFCHGVRGTGGEKGPDLLRSVLVLDDENGKSIGQVILNGRPQKGMPKFAMTPEQIADIANFLHNSISTAADWGNYKVLNIVTGNAQAGEAYFNSAGKCASCHSVTGDLKGIGARYEPVTLQDKILMPGENQGDAPSKATVTVTVTQPSGESVEGTLLRIDDFNVALRDSSGNYRSFTRKKGTPRVEIHNPLKAHLDMLTHYTDTDIHNLTAYLVTLK